MNKYTNISIIDTLNIIKNYVHNDLQFARKTAIPQEKFLELVNLVLATTWYTFNSQFYQQTAGVTKGGPAEVYMQDHEQSAIFTILHPAKVWELFVDDVYSILKRMHSENFSITSKIYRFLPFYWNGFMERSSYISI